ncbi:MAG: LacI family DNA-binding transcriptional regulator [Lentisphaeria bacterium]|nr:LacI family DNA-binding transcriptional regulator [Lentisphaeria bacterium]
MKQRVTGEQIAKLAKVSPSTVSRALNPDQAWRISRAKREEIRLLSGQFGLRSRSARRAGVFLKTFRIALLLGSMERDLSQGQNLAIRHLCDRLQASGYILELIRVDFSPQKLVSSVKNILRSKEADVYVIGGGLLKGQSLEFLHKISSRLILRLNAQSVRNPYPEFHWLSYFIRDDRETIREALRSIPKSMLSGLVYFGRDNLSSRTKIATIRSCGTALGRDFSAMPSILFGGNDDIPHDRYYRIARRIVIENYDRLSGFSAFFCSGQSAYALYDELVARGRKPGKDFHMITYEWKSPLRPLPDDGVNYICYDLDAESDKLCEQIFNLIDDPTPRTVVFKPLFIPAGQEVAAQHEEKL